MALGVVTVVEDAHGVVVRRPREAVLGVLLHLLHDGIVGGELDVGGAYGLGLFVVGPILEDLSSVNGDRGPAVLCELVCGHGGGLLCSR